MEEKELNLTRLQRKIFGLFKKTDKKIFKCPACNTIMVSQNAIEFLKEEAKKIREEVEKVEKK